LASLYKIAYGVDTDVLSPLEIYQIIIIIIILYIFYFSSKPLPLIFRSHAVY